MPTKTWKSIEAKVAAVFGLKRRGADYGVRDSGKNDCTNIDGTESEHFSIEVKHGKKIGFQLIFDACIQAEKAARFNQEPVAVIHRAGDNILDSLVVQRLRTFDEWRLGSEGPHEGGLEDGT